MLRRISFVVVGIALAALLSADRLPRAIAAAPEIAGNWQLITLTAGGESTVCILKVETKDGKPAAAVLFNPPNAETSVTDIKVTDKTVSVTVKQVRTFGAQKATSEVAFVGVRGSDAKVILGSIGTATVRGRAKLVATDKEALGKDELFVRGTLPEPMTKAQQLSNRVFQAQVKAQQEKDAEKRKELVKEFTAARAEADEKIPGLYKEVVEKHADAPAAFDAAANLLAAAGRTKMTADEAEKLVKLMQKQGAPYGPLFTGVSFVRIVDTLAAQEGLAGVALAAIEPSAKALTADAPAALRAAVLGSYRAALEKAGKSDEAKKVSVELAKLEEQIDAEYLKTVPPFKPTAYTGRKDKDANKVAVLELFTGAQCPPCVAADVAAEVVQAERTGTDPVPPAHPRARPANQRGHRRAGQILRCEQHAQHVLQRDEGRGRRRRDGRVREQVQPVRRRHRPAAGEDD